ncbi:phosphohydrolase [Spirochaetia bacterium]|nr:phosphohydrolase [Spirochaetia bacterium]GHU33495.1 phosphohydrolase [Spirochaetia bacterium]
MKNKELFNEYAEEILTSNIFDMCKNTFSHGTISIYEHSLAVAELSFSMIEKSRLDKKCVVRAALLHDFFLYEWHIPGKRYLVHGWVHPAIAAKNAREMFNISDKEYSCIKTHMWPWTLFHPPLYKEGWIISFADKIIAIQETFLRRGKRHQLEDPGRKIDGTVEI